MQVQNNNLLFLRDRAGAGTAGKMMAFGPAAIVQSIYAEPDCGGAPTRTAQFLAYVCQDTPQGSEMVVRRTVMS